MSMRIIDLQRRLREIGRIRIGEKVDATDRNGKPTTRPAKIDVFRFTSRDKQVIEAAAKQWGGTLEPWADGPGGGQWQVKSRTQQIPVIVPPGDMSFSQAYEQWTAGGCKVRCDGRWDHIADRTCHCDPEARDCNIHTRLSVIVPDLPGLGVWRLETHGYYAAVELGGLVDICAAQSAQGVMLPARLRLEHREVKRPQNGKVQTLKFVVPVLDLDVHPLALSASVIGPQLPASEQTALPAPRLTPVPPPAAALMPSIADQIAAVDEPPSRKARANAAQPMPATGLRPRTAIEAEAAAEPPDEGPPPDQSPLNSYNAVGLARRATEVFRADYDAAPRGTKTKVVDRLRHAAIYAVTKGRTASSKDCDQTELGKVTWLLEDIAAGRATYTHDQADDAGVTFRLQSGREATVLWTELEGQPGAGTELPLEQPSS